jgi:release factor glutamine methyltransferase
MPRAEIDSTLAMVVADAAERLRTAGSPTARLDAELLVAHLLGRDRAWLHAHPEAIIAAQESAEVSRSVERRVAGEPIAYIRGFKDWFSLRILTDARALIPRPETELLAEAAIAEIAARLARDGSTIAVRDVGTGSGALALALALRFRTSMALGRVQLAASDTSPEALELAAENLAAHGVASLVTLALADLLDSAGGRLPAPDVLVANLPYVPTDEVASRAGSLRYEPHAALDGGPDGLDVVHRLLTQLPERLAPGGVALLEIGAGQAEAVRALAEELRVRCAISSMPDLAGIDRVVRIARI